MMASAVRRILVAFRRGLGRRHDRRQTEPIGRALSTERDVARLKVRVALTPEGDKELRKLGFIWRAEEGLGASCGINDDLDKATDECRRMFELYTDAVNPPPDRGDMFCGMKWDSENSSWKTGRPNFVVDPAVPEPGKLKRSKCKSSLAGMTWTAAQGTGTKSSEASVVPDKSKEKK